MYASCKTSEVATRLLEPAVEAELDHPPQSLAILGEQLSQRELIAGLEAVEQSPDVRGLIHRRVLGSMPGSSPRDGNGSRKGHKTLLPHIMDPERRRWKGERGEAPSRSGSGHRICRIDPSPRIRIVRS